MSEETSNELRKIHRALISVSDKTGIVDFARELQHFGVEIVSTGGTARALRDAGIEVRDVSDVTGFPELMDGRVKTLHPKIHGALLGLRNNAEHVAAMREHGIEPIDLVVVNLYPFEQTVMQGVTMDEAVEQIDIGGPAMIRSAAKNWRDVAVLVASEHYQPVLDEMKKADGALSRTTRLKLARQAFNHTAGYDMRISAYLTSSLLEIGDGKVRSPATMPGIGGHAAVGSHFSITQFARRASEQMSKLVERGVIMLQKKSDLRYGENPHQQAALYDTGWQGGIANSELLAGKEMSFNNYVDADATWQLVSEFENLACAIVKHTNPAGVALGRSVAEAYRKALACDPVSAFGGIVAANRSVDEAAARAIIEIFTEVVIAPGFEPAALEVLKTKKGLRVLRAASLDSNQSVDYKQISGGLLVQTRDAHRLKPQDLSVMTKRSPSEKELEDLLFAWTVCKHTKSNAIVYARDQQTVGVGAGQMSRVDSVRIGAMRAQLPIEGSVLASDAFFPFRDGLDEAAKHRITAVIQPGGSVRDNEVIAAADEHGLAMVFTGIRHFKH